MKYISLLFLLLSFYATASVNTDNTHTMGSGAVDKNFKFNNGAATKPGFKWNQSASKIQASHDGVTFFNLGSGGGGGGGGVNLLTSDDNSDFEQCSGGTCAGWTASGGSVSTESSTPLFGSKSAIFDASALNQTFSSTAKSIPEGLKNQNCLAMVAYKFSGSDGDYKLQVYDGSTVLAEQALSPSTTAAVGYVGFECPSTGTVLTRLIAGVSNPAAITLDGSAAGAGQVQLGSNILLAQVANSEFYGSVYFPVAANCQWSTSSGSFASYAADSDCTLPAGGNVKGKASAPATKIPAIKLDNLPKGVYKFIAYGEFLTTNGQSVGYRFTDGTLNGNDQIVTGDGANEASPVIVGTIEQTSAGNRVVEIQGFAIGGSADIRVTGSGLTIEVWKYPSTSDTVLSGIDASAQYASAYHGTDCGWSFNNAAPFADPAVDATCTFTSRVARGIGALTSYLSGGDKLPGVVFTPAAVGAYEVCANYAGYVTAPGEAAFFELDVGGSQIATAISYSHGSGGGGKTQPICGIYEATSLSAVTVKLQGYTTAGNTFFYNGGGLEPVIEWNVKLISQAFPMPFLVKQLQSSSDSVMRHSTAAIANNGTASITRQDGSWISSVNRFAQGNVTVNFNSAFSSAPNCVVSADGISRFGYTTNGSASSIDVVMFDTSPTAQDTNFILHCTGPK